MDRVSNHWTKRADAQEIWDRIKKKLKGRKVWNKGLKGAIKNPLKGKQMPEEWAEKAKLGRVGKCGGWNMGKSMTTEQKEKLRIAHLGKKATLATRLKLSKIRKEMVPWNKGMGLGWPEQYTIRNSLKYKLWREAVFKRDDWTCVFCKKRGVHLHADHIRPFAKYPKYRFRISNGRTLCVSCHRKTLTYGGKVNHKPTQ